LVFTSRILTLLVVGFTKCSVILFLRQLFAGTSNKGRTICSGLLVGTCCWMVASVLAVAIDCHPSGALLLESDSQCPGDVSACMRRFQTWKLTYLPAYPMETGDRIGCLARAHLNYTTSIFVLFYPDQSPAEAHDIWVLLPSDCVSSIQFLQCLVAFFFRG